MIVIASEELHWEFSRSGGPGGQNVNKVETRARLSFDFESSKALSESQKDRLRTSQAVAKYRHPTTGHIVITSQEHRTQLMNRTAAVERLDALIARALKPVRVRKATKTPKRAHAKRLKAKKQRSSVRQSRSHRPDFD